MSHHIVPACLLLLALGGSQARPQTQVDLRTQSKSVDFAGATSTRPAKTGTSLPPSCQPGELFFRTDAAPGGNLYGCTSAGWSLQAGGGGGGTPLPDMTSRANQFLSTDGVTASWRAITAGPSGALQVTHSAGDVALDIVSAVLPQKTAANSFTGLNTFTQGLQLAPTEAPSGPSNGRMWYDSSLNKFRCQENSVTKDCIGAGAGGGAVSSVFGRIGDVFAQDNDYAGTANTYTAGKKQTFQASAGTAGARVVCGALPSSPASGDIACDGGDFNRLKAYDGTAWMGLSDSVTPANTVTLTNKTIDVESPGNTLTTVHYHTWLAANCQGGGAVLGFATPSSGAPTAACVTGTNTIYGIAQFLDTGTARVQGRFPLPPDWTGSIDFDLRWRSTATTGSAVWQIQTACVADGETGDPSWNTAQTITDGTKGTANQFNDAALGSALTLTGCAAGKELFFRFFRDPAHPSDDLNATAELLWLRFKLRRSQ